MGLLMAEPPPRYAFISRVVRRVTKEGEQEAYLRVQVLALYNVSEGFFRSYLGLNLNPIKPVLTLGISRCRQISNLCLYRSLAKRDIAINVAGIIGGIDLCCR